MALPQLGVVTTLRLSSSLFQPVCRGSKLLARCSATLKKRSSMKCALYPILQKFCESSLTEDKFWIMVTKAEEFPSLCFSLSSSVHYCNATELSSELLYHTGASHRWKFPDNHILKIPKKSGKNVQKSPKSNFRVKIRISIFSGKVYHRLAPVWVARHPNHRP